MKKIILLAILNFSFNSHAMLVKKVYLPFTQKPLVKPTPFMNKTEFNYQEINLQAFAENIALKKALYSLEQQNRTLKEEIKELIVLQNNGKTATQEIISFRSSDQYNTHGE